MKNILLIVFFTLFPSKFFTQEWVYLGGTDKIKASYIQNIKINSEGSYPKVWSKDIYPAYLSGKISIKNAEVIALCSYDCSERRTKLLSFRLYDSKGKTIQSRDFSEYENDWQYVTPESLSEEALNYVCEKL